MPPLPKPISSTALASEAAFMTRYETLLVWAGHLTAGDHQMASDVVHDAFLHFTTATLDLASISNLDGYLYTILRNLCRSKLRQLGRQRPTSLDLIEFDSVRLGLVTRDHHALLEARQELQAFCEYACQRRHTSRRGSVLLLRFFHGLTPNEAALVLQTSRASTDELLRVARREAKDFLAAKRQGSLDPAWSIERPQGHGRPEETLPQELLHFIFQSPSGDCPSENTLRVGYSIGLTEKIDTSTIGHIVGCRTCFSAVLQLLSISPDDTDIHSAETSDRQVVSISSRQASSARNRFLRKARRNREILAASEPRQLLVAVNGNLVASERVRVEHSDFSVSYLAPEPVEFIEVFSEQGLRLIMLPVLDGPPLGCHQIHGEVALTSGRLAVSLRFVSPCPLVEVQYTPSLSAAPEMEVHLSDVRRTPEISARGWLKSIGDLLVWSWPRTVAAVGSIILVILLLLPPSAPRLTAGVAIRLMADWEKRQGSVASPVVHRRFLLTRSKPNSVARDRRIVDVWISGSDKIAEVRAETGNLIVRARVASSMPPTLSIDNVWLFEPSIQTLHALAMDAERFTVRSSSRQGIELYSPFVAMTLDGQYFEPISGVLIVGGENFLFERILTESLLLAASPFGPKPSPPEKRATLAPSPRRAAAALALSTTAASAGLARQDLAARTLLFTHRVDVPQFQLVERRGGLRLEAMVVNEQLREILASALREIGLAELDLPTPAEAQLRDRLARSRGDERRLEETASSRIPAILGEALLRKLGSEQAANQFALDVVRQQRVSAPTSTHWRALSQRFSPSVQRSLSKSDRKDLLRLQEAMVSALRAETTAFDRSMLPFLDTPGPKRSFDLFDNEGAAMSTCEDWQSASQSLGTLLGQQRRIVTALFSTRLSEPATMVTATYSVEDLRRLSVKIQQALDSATCPALP